MAMATSWVCEVALFELLRNLCCSSSAAGAVRDAIGRAMGGCHRSGRGRDSDPGVLIPYPRLGRAFNLLEHGGIGGGRAVPAARPASGCRARSRARGERRERASARGPDSPGCARACDRLADGVRAVRRALPRAWVRLERRTALAPMVCAAPRAAAADASEVARRANAHRSARRLDRCQWARPRVRGIM